MDSLFKTYTRDEMHIRHGTSRKLKKLEEKKKIEEAKKVKACERELNPYYKNGGSGLPTEGPTSISKNITSSYDSQWLQKALARAKIQAREEGRSLEDVAADRWGSLDTFYKLLNDAEKKTSNPDRQGNSEEKIKNSIGNTQSTYRDSHSRSKARSRSGSRSRSRSGSRCRDSSGKSKARNRSRSRCKSRNKSKSRSKSSCSRSSSSSSRDSCSRSKSGSRCRVSSSRRKARSRSKSISSSNERSRSGSSCRDTKNTTKNRSRSSYGDSRSRSRSRSSEHRSDSCSTDKRDSKICKRKSSHKRRERNEDYSSRRSYNSSEPFCSTDKKKRRGTSKEKTDHSRNLKVGMLCPMADDEDDVAAALSDKFMKHGDSSHRGVMPMVTSFPDQSSYRNMWRKKTGEEPLSRLDKQTITVNRCSDSPPKIEEESRMKPPKKKATIQVLSDKEMNHLAARLTKAELQGNEKLIKKLKERLESAQSVREQQANEVKSEPQDEEVVILTRTDGKGYTRPVPAENLSERRAKGQQKKKVKTHNQEGQRIAYFPDDHKYDLKAVFVNEKNTSVDDELAVFAKESAKAKINSEYDIDDLFVSEIAPKESLVNAKRERELAIKEHHRTQKTLDSCHYCLENKLMKKHLVVSLGSKCYLSLPYHESLTRGHCFIIPMSHTLCSTRADEDQWEEIMIYRRALVRLFDSLGEDCVFLEMALGLRNLPHMIIQCVPLPREVGDMAPVYFKKAIEECDEEWAQNKKLIDLKGRSVRSAVPKELPYFWIDFGLSAGYAHVIEDERKFSRNFGLEIIGGMIDADTSLFRKPKPESFEMQRKKVLDFAEIFKEYDPAK